MKKPRLSWLLLPLAAIGASACATVPKDPGPPTPVVDYLTEQEILTPLPLRVSLPARYNAEHVIVLFKTWGSYGWSQLELARSGQTWSGEVSCRHVSTVTGDTRYFFLALDEDGDVVGGSGSPEWPHVATIVGKLPNGPRALREGSLPLRCHDPADCPPDFPGCPGYAFSRKECRSDRDCAEGERCAWDGYCGQASGPIMPTVQGGSEDEQLMAAVRAVTSRYRKSAASAAKSRTN
jgi:hypothetical protein